MMPVLEQYSWRQSAYRNIQKIKPLHLCPSWKWELKQLGVGVEQGEEERLKTLVLVAPDVNLNPIISKARP